MIALYVIIGFVLGIIIGILIMFIIHSIKKKEASELAKELINQTEKERIEDIEKILMQLKDSFSSLSFDALNKNTDAFLKLANETLKKQSVEGQKELESKKALIDKNVEGVSKSLSEMIDLVHRLERDREQKFGELTNQLKVSVEETNKLRDTTSQLKEILSSSRRRGQWGERMVEDILRLAGFIEGVNYNKQKSLDTAATRPDYTFFLPNNMKLNMDVKFPLDNFIQYLDAKSDETKEKYKSQFLRDVKNRIKEVTTRDYINPSDKTVDYVLVFIPNEQIYGFINEVDNTVMDDAIKSKVVLCSPLTLYAMLAVIRQAAENFNLTKTADQILELMGMFKKQWEAFVSVLEKMGDRLDDAQKQYNTLITTRRNKLDRVLDKVDDLRITRGISINDIETLEVTSSDLIEEEDKNS